MEQFDSSVEESSKVSEQQQRIGAKRTSSSPGYTSHAYVRPDFMRFHPLCRPTDQPHQPRDVTVTSLWAYPITMNSQWCHIAYEPKAPMAVTCGFSVPFIITASEENYILSCSVSCQWCDEADRSACSCSPTALMMVPTFANYNLFLLFF